MSIKALEVAIDARLRGDATLAGLLGQGIWNMQRPDVELDAGTLAWAIFRLQGGGDTNDRPGRWKNVVMYAGGTCGADEGAGHALEIDARIEDLLHDWTPALTGWEEVWAAQRENAVHFAAGDEAAVKEYSTGGLYRFRFGTLTDPVPPATAQDAAAAASGDVPLVQAIYDRLQRDATLVALAPAGVRLLEIDSFNDVRQIELVGGEPALSDTTLETPTWVELSINTGGPTNDATGPQFRDVEILAQARSFADAGSAIDADERIDALLFNWTPPATGYTGWKVTRVADRRYGFRVPVAERLIWQAGGVYRVRAETSSA